MHKLIDVINDVI